MTDNANPAGPADHRFASASAASIATANGSAPADASTSANASTSADASTSANASGPQARFEFLAVGPHEPAIVRCSGDIDLTNVGQFKAALDQAAATSSAVTADMTAVDYCDSAAIRALFSTARRARLTIQVSTAGPINETMLKISGLDQIATVVTLN